MDSFKCSITTIAVSVTQQSSVLKSIQLGTKINKSITGLKSPLSRWLKIRSTSLSKPSTISILNAIKIPCGPKEKRKFLTASRSRTVDTNSFASLTPKT